jgi:hypothetical protein
MPPPLASTALRRAAIACGAAVLFACSASAPNLAGVWKSERTTLTITQDGNSYRIVAENPKGILGGNHSAEFHDGRIDLKAPLGTLCGDMKYAQDTGKLTFCTEEFVKTPQ